MLVYTRRIRKCYARFARRCVYGSVPGLPLRVRLAFSRKARERDGRVYYAFRAREARRARGERRAMDRITDRSTRENELFPARRSA